MLSYEYYENNHWGILEKTYEINDFKGEKSCQNGKTLTKININNATIRLIGINNYYE